MNIIDYVKNNGHRTFSTLSFNEIDALVLARLSYLNYNNINTSFVDVIDTCNLNSYETSILLSKRNMGDVENDERLIREVLSSSRYHGVKFANYVNDHDEKQFCAITFIFEDFICVSFMGTDDSVVGWKEDFAISYLPNIPSQIEGVKYLNKVANLYNKPIILTGHSKGGNVAIYSLCHVDEEIRKRIIKVYTYDSPGFNKEFVNTNAYGNKKDIIEAYIPESSFIGLIMYPIDECKIVSSNKLFMFQHNVYNWLVDDTGFVYKESLNRKSLAFAESNRNWIESFSNEERQIFFETIFDLFENNDISSFLELKKDFKEKITKIVDSSSKISEDNKKLMKKIIKNMISSYLDLLFDRKK